MRGIALQVMDSGTSIGANLEEATAGQSKRDFIARNYISLKESRETRYWLRVLAATEPGLQQEIGPLVRETTELVAIITAIIRKASSNPSRGTSD